MTKSFNAKITCKHCGEQTDAESAFCRWMRWNRKLDSGLGIIRTDMDHIVLRYKTPANGKEKQLLMVIESKEYGGQPDPAQHDLMAMFHQLINDKGRNMYGAPTVKSKRVRSILNNRQVNVRFYGYHLLQFEKTRPDDSAWIKWDHKVIDVATLEGLLSMDLGPYNPTRTMDELLRDRHHKAIDLCLPLQLTEAAA